MPAFIFSADAHIREPHDLFRSKLPAGMRDQALHVELTDKHLLTKTGDRVVYRLERDGEGDIGREKRRGASNLTVRREDLDRDGIDAEVCYPTLAMMTYYLDDPQNEAATAEIYNEWINTFFAPHRDRFVPCGVLPVRDREATLTEMRRLHAFGLKSAMLPVVTPRGVPQYNSAHWDRVLETAGKLGMALIFHTGTGLEQIIQERGPGAAVVNYSRQMNDGINTVMMLVAGGGLDRYPDTQIAVIESGASWLSALAERMDEVYNAHHYYVRPKLSMLPSEIIRRQVKCAFQHDRACIMSRGVTGTRSLMWASDYPHAEGTFPNSRDIVRTLFDGIEISEKEKADILGGTAARLFGFEIPQQRATAPS